ncbi:MAG: glycosyltransferase [Bacteroidetes bacterium]|nr:glycosyltransferase [Bacteroidota bacterium]
MRILVLLNRIPWPLNDGGAIGAYHFVKGYADAGCDVTCLAMNTARHHVDLKDTGTAFRGVGEFVPVDVDNRIKPIDAALNLLTGQSYIMARFDSKAYRAALVDLLQRKEFDVIHIDGLPPCLYIDTCRQYSKAKLVQRAHNVEYKIWERGAVADSNPLKRWYLGIQAARLKDFERAALGRVDTVLAISTEDEGFIKELQPAAKTIIVPAGMDIDENMPAIQPPGVSLFFIGALDWLPNLQGLEWFLKEVWPQVHAAYPKLKFHIAGKKMPEQFYNFTAMNIEAHGEVPSSVAFINSHSVLLSPLVSGSGVRIKIIEAMAMGKVVLSTTVSAEGSGATDGQQLLIANDANEYISQIGRLLTEPDLMARLSRSAREFALDRFQNKKIISRLLDYYKTLCS